MINPAHLDNVNISAIVIANNLKIHLAYSSIMIKHTKA